MMSYIKKVFTKRVLNLIFGLKPSEPKPEQKHEKLPWKREFPILFDDNLIITIRYRMVYIAIVFKYGVAE